MPPLCNMEELSNISGYFPKLPSNSKLPEINIEKLPSFGLSRRLEAASEPPFPSFYNVPKLEDLAGGILSLGPTGEGMLEGLNPLNTNNTNNTNSANDNNNNTNNNNNINNRNMSNTIPLSLPYNLSLMGLSSMGSSIRQSVNTLNTPNSQLQSDNSMHNPTPKPGGKNRLVNPQLLLMQDIKKRRKEGRDNSELRIGEGQGGFTRVCSKGGEGGGGGGELPSLSSWQSGRFGGGSDTLALQNIPPTHTINTPANLISTQRDFERVIGDRNSIQLFRDESFCPMDKGISFLSSCLDTNNEELPNKDQDEE